MPYNAPQPVGAPAVVSHNQQVYYEEPQPYPPQRIAAQMSGGQPSVNAAYTEYCTPQHSVPMQYVLVPLSYLNVQPQQISQPVEQYPPQRQNHARQQAIDFNGDQDNNPWKNESQKKTIEWKYRPSNYQEEY